MAGNLILGIDVGGSKIRAVLLSSLARWDSKKVLKAREITTPRSLIAFKIALKSLSNRIAKLGIAVPGRISSNVFVSATNLPYVRNFNFAKFFLGAKVKVDHDARCFARAEYKDKQTTLFLTLGTGVGRAVGKGGKILKIKSFEYPVRWEKEYKKIRDSHSDAKLAKFLAKKLNKLLGAHGVRRVVIGGGVATRKSFATKLQKTLGLPVKKSKFGKNSVAIGAALQF